MNEFSQNSENCAAHEQHMNSQFKYMLLTIQWRRFVV